MASITDTVDRDQIQKPPDNVFIAQLTEPKHSSLSHSQDTSMNNVEHFSSSSSFSNSTNSTTSSCCSLKRKRPPRIDISRVLREIHPDKLNFRDKVVEHETNSFDGAEVGVFSIKGKKKVMEDTYKIVSRLCGDSNKGFYGVYDGHGGRKAADFVAENLHINILEMLEKHREDTGKEDAIKAGYLKTDQDFVKQGLSSGSCCVTALIDGKDIAVSNLGDCRAVLCRGGSAEVLTKDHTASLEEERNRIERKGGYVEIHRGAWRVHGILSVSRSIGDVHLKDWVMAEPDTTILHLTPDMEFLVLASDGLWEKVGNQEVVDTTKRIFSVAKSEGSSVDCWQEDGYEFGYENISPPLKLRRISQIKQQVMSIQIPSEENIGNKRKSDDWKDRDDFGCENQSSPLKLQRLSLIKQHNWKINLSSQDSSHYEKRSTTGVIIAACKELANLAVSRGSLDDITVMIIDLKQFQFKSR